MHHANVWHISKRKNDNDYFYCRYFTFCLFSAKLNFAPISLSIPFDFWTEIIDKKGYNDWIEIIWLDSFFFLLFFHSSCVPGVPFFCITLRSLPHSLSPSLFISIYRAYVFMLQKTNNMLKASVPSPAQKHDNAEDDRIHCEYVWVIKTH